jgi:hypothetical protein
MCRILVCMSSDVRPRGEVLACGCDGPRRKDEDDRAPMQPFNTNWICRECDCEDFEDCKEHETFTPRPERHDPRIAAAQSLGRGAAARSADAHATSPKKTALRRLQTALQVLQVTNSLQSVVRRMRSTTSPAPRASMRSATSPPRDATTKGAALGSRVCRLELQGVVTASRGCTRHSFKGLYSSAS